MFIHTPQKTASKKDSKSFYTSLLLSFLAVAVTSSLLLTIFLTGSYLKSAMKSATTYNQQLLSQTNYAIDEMNSNVERLTFSLLGDINITAYLSLLDRNSTAPVLASQVLDKQLMVLPYIESIYLYNSNIDLLYSSKTGFQQPLAECTDEEIKSRLNDADFFREYEGQPLPSHLNSATGSYDIFSYYIPDRYSGQSGKKNTIVINVYASTLTDSIESMKERSSRSGTSFVLLDQDMKYITSVPDAEFRLDSANIDQIIHPDKGEPFTDSSISVIDGTHYFQTYTNANDNGWYLLNFIPARLVFRNLTSAALFGCLILIGVLFLGFMACRYFARRLNSPVETITRQLEEHGITPQSFTSGPKEFQMIVSALVSLQEKNSALRSLQEKSRYTLTQSFLYKLVTNHHLESPLLLKQDLEQLNLTHLKENKLCMALLKIDRYQEFLSERNPEELWAIRFAVVNITEELTTPVASCNAFSCDNDKFVLLMNMPSDKEISNFEEKLLSLFESIQNNISSYLNFTVTIAYSTIFQGIENLPVVYKNLDSSLSLKMRCGHSAIINPYLMEEQDTESFHFSGKTMYQLIDRLIEGQFEEAFSIYTQNTENLFYSDYDEILPTLIHLLYSIYERMAEKYPMLKDSLSTELKSILLKLESSETSEDIQSHMRNFFTVICNSVKKLKEDPANQNAAVTAQKIARIIEEEYTNPALCLCSIADKIDLSSNYTGHIFRQYMHKSVAQYILDLRMEKLAWYLQTTDYPLTKILDLIGMEKNNYFYTRFKKYFGMSLGEYRQQFQDAGGGED
ncbi:AraC family transcriptional regulator [Blautia schinkii]|nr:AraC family transcriptional regulator [Blautia schinkii]